MQKLNSAKNHPEVRLLYKNDIPKKENNNPWYKPMGVL